jgi:hypothetical protein
MLKFTTTFLIFLSLLGISPTAKADPTSYQVDVPIARAGLEDPSAGQNARAALLQTVSVWGIKTGDIIVANFNDGLSQTFVVTSPLFTHGVEKITEPTATQSGGGAGGGFGSDFGSGDSYGDEPTNTVSFSELFGPCFDVNNCEGSP